MKVANQVTLATLALLLGASCGNGGEAKLEANPRTEVPALPQYLDGFDPSVRELIVSSHEELLANPEDAQLWMKLGMAFEAHNEAGEAVPCYEAALDLRPEKPRWWYRLAMAQQASDQLQEALDSIDRSIAIHNGYGPAHWRRGLWLLEVAREEEARESFKRATMIDGKDPAGRLGLVQVQLRLGEYAEAASALEGSPLLQGPNGPWAKKLLGTAYQRAGREDEARVLLADTRDAKPIYQDPWNADLDGYRRGMAALNRRARALIATGRAPEAASLLEEALTKDPDHVPVMRTLGAAYAAAGRTKSALEILKAASNLEPENTELRVDAAWAYALHGETQTALAEVLDILKSSPESNKAHVLHAQLMMDQGRNEEAILAFDKAMEFGARNPKMLVDIGKKQIDLGRLPDAMNSFVLAAQQDPASQPAWIGQAIVGIELSKFDEAEAALIKAEELAALRPGQADPIIAQIRNQLDSLRASGEGSAEAESDGK